MKRCILLLVPVFIAAAMSITTQIANAVIVSDSLLLNYNAANNVLAGSNQWKNLGSVASADLIPFETNPVHTLNDASDVSFYSMPNAGGGAGEGWIFPGGTTINLGGTSFTAEVWARLVDNFEGATEHQIFSLNAPDLASTTNRLRGSTNNLSGDPNLVDIMLNTAGGSTNFLADAGNQAGPVNMRVSEFVPAEWFQLAFVWDHLTNTLSFYANSDDPTLTGADLRHTQTRTQPLDSSTYHLMLFQSGPDGDVRRWPGDISIFRLYGRALSEQEIQQNFDAGNAIVPEPTSVALLGMGLAGLLLCLWRKRKMKA